MFGPTVSLTLKDGAESHGHVAWGINYFDWIECFHVEVLIRNEYVSGQSYVERETESYARPTTTTI